MRNFAAYLGDVPNKTMMSNPLIDFGDGRKGDRARKFICCAFIARTDIEEARPKAPSCIRRVRPGPHEARLDGSPATAPSRVREAQ
jgi:hypothetical protein